VRRFRPRLGRPRPGRLRLGRLRLRGLRCRLIAGTLLLFAVACAVVGVVTTLALRGFLVNRLDQQLAAAGGRYAVSLEHHDEGGFGDVRGQSVGTFGARLAGGRITESGVVADRRARVVLSGADTARLVRLPADARPRTVRLDSLGAYRMTAMPGRDGDILVTGLPLERVEDVLARLELIETLVFGAVLVASAFAVSTLVRLALRPLRRVAATATKVAELPLADGEVSLPARVAVPDPRTEVGQVASAFDHMLEHVESALARRQASEDRLRRFVADASHELRTPLAAIRGHAELARRDTAHVGTALGRIEAEASRMGRLVDDLLLLARLDAGRPLAHEPVDLTRMAIDTVSDAHAAAPDHHWALELPEEPVTVYGDEFRLQQVLGNLLGNARTHTPPGTRVTVRLRPPDATGTVVLDVLDDGPGLPADLGEDVFARFVRGDGSRSRSRRAGGAGLGLAIVSAVVQAHGGTAEVSGEPGHTRFRVRLPAGGPQSPRPGPLGLLDEGRPESLR
jgi:two-component system, OmpR family, sensor kinase